ncbi:MAG: DUF3987 domain-containing protein [Verrucomicrobia bacterium]|nr:DUF3987 domain-containing protein [Verrucomicrobiota bacterium]MDA1066113.1 DUF3987 domain-containing protein [Verrucomicrobiota bacterium]
MNRNLETALKLREIGIACIPTNGKTAIYPWKRWQDDLPDPDLYRTWFSNGRNIALIGGKVKCLDFDEPEIYPLFEQRAKESGLGDIVDRLIRQKTPSGGCHLVWQSDGAPLPNTKLAEKQNREVLIETRGKGGYFLIAPSEGYELTRGSWEGIPCLNEDEQASLLDLARSFNQNVKEDPRRETFASGELTPGDEYDQSGNFEGLLEKHGWTKLSEKYWRRPGKDKGVSASYNHIPGRFCCFSTSTVFEAEKVYKPFAVYAILEHDGDFSAAASALRPRREDRALDLEDVIGRNEEENTTYQDAEPEDREEAEMELPEMPFPLNEIVSEAVSLYGVHPDMPTLQVLCAVSAAMRKSFKLRIPPFETFGNIFGFVTAISGSGKTLTSKLINRPLHEWEIGMQRHWELRVKPSVNAQIQILKGKQKRLAQPSKQESESNCTKQLEEVNRKMAELEARSIVPSLLVEDVTTQALGMMLQANDEYLALLSSEAGDVVANLFGRNNSNNRTDEHLYLKAFSGESGKVNRVGREPVMLREPVMTVCLSSTPDELSGLFNTDRFVTGGLLPRFLICLSKSPPMRDDGTARMPDPGVRERWEACLHGILNINETLTVIPTPEAEKVFRDYGNKYADASIQMPKLASFNTRRREIAQRIALIIHVAQHGPDAGHIRMAVKGAETACKLSDYYGRASAKIIMKARQGIETGEVERIIDTARQHGEQTADGYQISLRDIKRLKDIKPDRVKELATSYGDLLKIETLSSNEKGGRPSTVVIVSRDGGDVRLRMD